MRIEQATNSDRDELIKLHYFYGETFPFVPKSRKQGEIQWMDYYLDNQGEFLAIFVARDSTEIKGNIWIGRQREPEWSHKAGFGIVVSPDMHQQGIGSRLLEQAESWAQDQNCHSISVDVVSIHQQALSFFKKHGYDIEATRKESYLQETTFFDEHIMTKFL
ncbi:hypothetical protein MTBPR1_120079 [Candidatus Terasakiella magnetica]|uniref:N-acetyltransferase domain-containing protein n=1 Tax=Candidatus Terasakiella magnetica TaxID=1867952 RepID=A0A1C3REQ8_9PROT|nr:GNAT family N-acetyltransferase [Candidatus Terasakiella magnetica]SCA55773.1 hypothetical protein MTBPR1_120079 [Candidatus Terasakiella magnetica]